MEYFLHRDGQQWGPYDEATLRSMLATQQVLPTDLIWNEQMPDWATVEAVFPTSTPVPASIPAPTPIPTPVAVAMPMAAAGKATATPTEKPTVKAKSDKNESGKKSSLPKIAAIAVAGLAVIGVALWFFVLRGPSEVDLTDLELDQMTATVYLKGCADPFTGKAVSKYHGGQQKVEINFSNGMEEGPYILWHENGQLMHQADYSAGAFSGSVKWWDETGTLILESSYAGGKETLVKTNATFTIPLDAIPDISERLK